MPKKQAPIWIRRLDVVKAELRNVRFPKSAYEGSRQCAELSERQIDGFWNRFAKAIQVEARKLSNKPAGFWRPAFPPRNYAT